MKNRTLVAFVTFGNKNFSKLALQSIRETSTEEVDFFVVVGKPGDNETIKWLQEEGIPHKLHAENFGFPYSINDIYDYAWKENDYEFLIIMGNDIVAYPNAIDQLIHVADTTDYQLVSALQYDVKMLTTQFPETKQFFRGANFTFSDFTQTPWKAFTDYNRELEIADMALLDIQNLCLYKKGVFDAVGYTDVNFFPAYWVDNDYAMRIHKKGTKGCTVTSASFFHFWSRVLYQESGGSDSTYFKNNKEYYEEKWGGDFGKETKTPPLGIFTREGELDTINKWKRLHG